MKHHWLIPPHATPIDDISGLKISGIQTYKELSNQETETIFKARKKYFRNKPQVFLFSEGFILKIHKDMLGAVWDWAGCFRKTQTNVGVKPFLISVELKKLVDDYLFWSEKAWNPIEMAARIHHRLTFIHPFENGNGRHARFVSDLFLHHRDLHVPNWPKEVSEETPLREAYIQALKRADQGDYSVLEAYLMSS